MIPGVPGFTAAMVRHLHSLRRMQRDHGWIHTLLEEAENERMHLMTFLQLRKPGPIFRFGVIATQYVFTFSNQRSNHISQILKNFNIDHQTIEFKVF